jgi:hypothetical protein
MLEELNWIPCTRLNLIARMEFEEEAKEDYE